MALQSLHHVIRMDDEVRELCKNKPIRLDLSMQIAGEVGHVFEADQDIAGEVVEIGLGHAQSGVSRAQSILKLHIHVGRKEPFPQRPFLSA